ncbi:MAG: IS1595 family transposase [Fimbriimonadaceae bacterium]|nr:IS1595 family transposase [Fimbriimonadaceae bacterium]QYK58961.1 MAG: IS1595 family transposase [Fimbriimonadaceae bacterium]
MAKARYTLRDFQRQFPTDDSCLEWLVGFLYPAGIPCPNCDKVTKHHKLKGRKAFSCDMCGHQAHPTAGTIFHKSSTPLTSWFYAIYLMSSTRTGVPAKQLERELGVTYKTAWRMFKQIRSMLSEDVGLLTGRVEIDDTYYGGRESNKQLSKRNPKTIGGRGKTIILGMAEQGGEIVTTIINNTDRKTMEREIVPRVHGHAQVFTDSHRGFDRLDWHFVHFRVDHEDQEYARGRVSTNAVEGFWGNFKSGTKGAYKHIDPKYLQNYLDEYTFRYNRRRSDVAMFNHFMAQVSQLDWWVPYPDPRA